MDCVLPEKFRVHTVGSTLDTDRVHTVGSTLDTDKF